jgi:nucleotide-binding universal stress UspA family protein
LEANASRVLDSRKENLIIEAENRIGAKKIKNHSISVHVAIGDNTAKKIVEYARRYNADLIVMSSRSTAAAAPKNRIGGALKLLLGSVSRAVSEMASCPVLLIRPVQQEPE